MPLGKWWRPAVVAGVTAGAVIVGEVIQYTTREDLKAIAAKYPVAQSSEALKGLLGGLPLIGGIVAFLAGTALESTAEATMTEEDKSKYKLDKALLTWVPIVEIVVLLVGIPVSIYLVWIDVIRGPTATQAAAVTSLATAPVAKTLVPVGTPVFEAAERRSGQVLAESDLPAMGNPTTFERGTKARAVRDVLAEHIVEGGGAEEPYAVASAIVKEKGPAKAAEGLPASEVKAELKEQAVEAQG